METLVTIIGIIIGTIIFFGINSMIEIHYFGCAAMLGLWFTCFCVGCAITYFAGGIILLVLKASMYLVLFTLFCYACYFVFKGCVKMFNYIRNSF